MGFKVFVSHSSEDREWVEWVKGQSGPGVELASHGSSLAERPFDCR